MLLLWLLDKKRKKEKESYSKIMRHVAPKNWNLPDQTDRQAQASRRMQEEKKKKREFQNFLSA